MREFSQEEAQAMFDKLAENEGPKGPEETTLQDKKETLQKLFTQALANFGVLKFNIKALQTEADKQYSQIAEMKEQLDILNKEAMQ